MRGVLCLFIIYFAFNWSAQGQAPASSPTPDPNQDLIDQKARLSLQKDIEDLKTGIAQDTANSIKAQVGTINTANLPTGAAQLTNVDIQPSIIGYSSLRSVVTKILADLYGQNPCPKATLVLQAPTIADVTLYDSYFKLLTAAQVQVDKYQHEPEEIKEPTVHAAFAPVAVFAAIDAVVALGSLFKSDVTISGVTLTADDEALRYMLIQKVEELCKDDKDKTKTTIIDPNNFAGPLLDDSKLLTLIAQLNSGTDQLQANLLDMQTTKLTQYDQRVKDIQKAIDGPSKFDPQIAKLQAELKTAKPSERDSLQKQIEVLKDKKQKELDKLKTDLQVAQANDASAKTYIAAVTGILARISSLNTALMKIDDTGTPFLMRLLKAEALKPKIKDLNILTVSTIKVGGNNVVKKNAFHTSIKYGGGALIKFQLKSADGLTVIAAGEEDAYEYHEEEDHLGSAKK